MIDFNKPHAVPQTTKSLINTDQKARQRQSKVYSRDMANNHRQMDDIRHAQYRKQNTAVKQQKSHMQDNAAKASKRVTGSSDYYKEERTLLEFLDLCEGKQARLRKERKEAREQTKAQTKAREMQQKGAAKALQKQRASALASHADAQERAGQANLARRADEYSAGEKAKKKERAEKKKDLDDRGMSKSAQDKIASEYASRKDAAASKAKKDQEAKERDEIDKAKKAREAEAAKEAVRDKKKKDKEERERRTSGFGSGLKSALGGDSFSRDEKTRRKARTEAGKRAGKFVRNAPGNIAKGAFKGAKFLGKGALGIAKTNRGMSSVSTSSAPSTTGVSKVSD